MKELFGGKSTSGNVDNLNESIVKRVGTYITNPDKISFLYSMAGEMKTLSNNLNKLPVDDFYSNITAKERAAMYRLGKNKQIVIKSADKGGGIVVMDTTYYKSRVEEQVSDHNTYEELVIFKKCFNVED